MKKIFLILLAVSLVFSTTACSFRRQTENLSTDDTHQATDCEHKKFEVVFQDFDGSVLKTETVHSGDSAAPPVGLKRDGYKFVKWDTAFDEVTENIVVKAIYEEIKEPTLIADTVYAQGKDVIVKVYIQKNPGILTLLLNTVYVESAMKLTKIESGQAMEGYTFVGPKNLSNACNAAWYTIDTPEKVTDGEVALLHFKLEENVAPGAYEISVSCDNGAFDANHKKVELDVIKGYIILSATQNEEGTK